MLIFVFIWFFSQSFIIIGCARIKHFMIFFRKIDFLIWSWNCKSVYTLQYLVTRVVARVVLNENCQFLECLPRLSVMSGSKLGSFLRIKMLFPVTTTLLWFFGLPDSSDYTARTNDKVDNIKTLSPNKSWSKRDLLHKADFYTQSILIRNRFL